VLTVINNGFPNCTEEKSIQWVRELTPPSTCRCLVGLLETSTQDDVKTYRFSYKMGRSNRQEKQNLPHCCRRYAPNCMRQGRVKFCSLQTILTRTGRIANKSAKREVLCYIWYAYYCITTERTAVLDTHRGKENDAVVVVLILVL